jgi:sulfoxide reductase heme-binding subunit YedZ
MTSLVAIGLHGAALLGDGWLKPGLAGISIPFELPYRPAFTGLGIVAGYMALLLGPSFFLRRRIGARRWRKLHRATAVVWGLAVVHTLGSGTDRGAAWLQVVVLAPAAPIVYALVMRLLVGGRNPTAANAPLASGRHGPPEPAWGDSALQ